MKSDVATEAKPEFVVRQLAFYADVDTIIVSITRTVSRESRVAFYVRQIIGL